MICCFLLTCPSHLFLSTSLNFGISRHSWLTLYFLCLSLESSISPRNPYSFSWRILVRSQQSAPDVLIVTEVLLPSHPLSGQSQGINACIYIFTYLFMSKHILYIYIKHIHAHNTYPFIFVFIFSISLSTKSIEFTLISPILIEPFRFILVFFSLPFPTVTNLVSITLRILII